MGLGSRSYKNTISLSEVQYDTYFLSVHCGSESTTFKAIVVLIESALQSGHWRLGEVCANPRVLAAC